MPTKIKQHEPSGPHVRMYRPDGSYATFEHALLMTDMERFAGKNLITQHSAGLDVCYSKDEQSKDTPISCELGDSKFHGTIFFGKYENGAMHPVAAKWFTGVNNSFVYDLLIWGAR